MQSTMFERLMYTQAAITNYVLTLPESLPSNAASQHDCKRAT